MARGAGGGSGLPRSQPNPFACLGKALNEDCSKGRGQGGGLLLCQCMEFLRSPSPKMPSPKFSCQGSEFKERGNCERGMEKGKALVSGLRCVIQCFLIALLIGGPIASLLCSCPSFCWEFHLHCCCLPVPPCPPPPMARFHLPSQEPSAPASPGELSAL